MIIGLSEKKKKKNRHISVAEVTDDCVTKVSVRTFRKAPGEQDFPSRVALKKPFLNNIHKAKRHLFTKLHKSGLLRSENRSCGQMNLVLKSANSHILFRSG